LATLVHNRSIALTLCNIKKMTPEQNKSKKQIIYFLKKNFPMEAAKGVRFDLKEYSIIEKGKFLKNIYTWKLTEFDFHSYFLSIRNSYKEEVSGTGGESMIMADVEIKHNAVIMTTDFSLPELTIRPAYFREKFANLFLSFDIKLNDRKSFNKKYILESSSNESKLEKTLTHNLTNELIKYDEFSLEFKNNTILLLFNKEFNEKDSVNLIKIGKIIETEIKNVAQHRL